MENPVDVAQKEAQNGIRRGRAKALLLFAAGERGRRDYRGDRERVLYAGCIYVVCM
jgi:hypothetical protein